MSDGVGIDPEGMRALGVAAGGLAGIAESARGPVLDIVVAGDLASDVGSQLALLAEELELLAALCAERAAAIEDAGTGWVSPLADLEGSLNDGWGSDGTTTPFALETLRLKREKLDTDGDGAVSADGLAAAATRPIERAGGGGMVAAAHPSVRRRRRGGSVAVTPVGRRGRSPAGRRAAGHRQRIRC